MGKLSVQPVVTCEPVDERCQRPISPNFLPGISFRHMPSCTDNVCGLMQCAGGNWRVTNENTLDRSKWIEGWIMTQLLTRGLVDCADHPQGKRDGGWWADSFRNADGQNARQFRSGSKLWALRYRHGGATNDMLLQAKSYAQQALSPLIGWGVASRITVDAFYIAKGNAPFPGAIIQLRITVSGPGYTSGATLEGSQAPNAEWLWREYMPPRATPMLQGRLHQRVAP